MHHLHLKEEFKNDKLKFFQLQAFDNNVLLKKWAMILLVALGIYQGILFQAILPKEVSITTPQTNYICTGLLSISITSYYTSIFKFSKKITKKIYLIRCILVFLSVVCLTISLGLISYRETLDRIEHNNIEKWFYTLTMDRNAVWVILLIDILIPIWYFKILVPGVYWVISIIVYYHFDMEYKEGIIICYSFAALFTAMLWGMKAYHEWKVFIDRMNIEAWDDVHRNILDKVPDAIAIIDEQAKVIYSNSTFKSLCQDNLEDLSQKLTCCKNPRATSFLDSGSHNNEGKSPLNPQTEETCTFSPFSEILQQSILPIIKEQQKLDNYLIFSARLNTNINNEASFRSYEIKLGALLEYNKVILILSDTTQRDRAISLDTANQYKDKLLATVSHDLRAPINGSVSLLESSIEHRAVPGFIKEQFLIPAQRSCKFLLHLVNDILDFSQINAQKLRTDFETNSLRETIKSCYQLLEMQAIKKKIDFRLVLDEKLPEMVTTDHNRLSQIIINLLTNAIKFTFSGSVTLSAHVIDDLVQIQVVDTGIGIRDEDKAKLFKEFTRIKYEQSRINTRGVGLGLMIANKLAQVLGPSHKESGINLSSVYGQGSRFEFTLEDKRPMDDSQEVDIPMEQKSSHFSLSFPPFINREEDFLFQKMDEGDLSRHGLQYSSQIPSGFSSRQILMSPSSGTYRYSTINSRKKHFRGRVLIVDDDPINVMALENAIQQYGPIADTAYNGQEAIDKIRQNKDNKEQLSEDQERMCDTPKKPLLTDSPYQIIFMDYEMPIMNGLETTQALRELMQSQKINTIPIIGCTGHQTKQAQEDGFASGMVDMITKPPVKKKLFEILERYLPSSD